MRVLITGGGGFIGSNLSDRLLERNHQVLVVDNFSTGRRDNLVARGGLTISEGDICDEPWLAQVFSDFQPETVVHAAASYKDPEAWTQDLLTNSLGSALVARAAERVSSRRIIYLQTSLCYGFPKQQPIPIDHPLAPEGSYAISKTTGERYLAMGQVELLSFRLANIYGPRNLSGPLPTFYHRLSEDKPCFVMNTRRDFLFIDDLLTVLVQAVEGVGRPGYYHVASGSDYSIRELYEQVLLAMQLPLPAQIDVREPGPDDVPTLLLDPAKTEAEFNWKAAVPLARGVPRAVEYYQRFGVTETYTHLQPMQG